jgi:hypothetical protein
LANVVPFTKLFYGVHYFLYYQHGQHVEGVTIIESSSNTKQGDPLGGPLFVLAHYQTFLKTITWAPSWVFPSLTNDNHIMGPMNEITHTFYHLSTQLTLIGLRVKVSKCKRWNPSRIFPSIEILQGCTLVTNGPCILGAPMGSQNFAVHFLDKALFQYMAHINDLPLLGDTHVVLGILSSCVTH